METATEALTLAEMKTRVRKRLPKDTFKTNPLRLLWVPFWIMVALAGYYVILGVDAHWTIKILMALMIGNCWSILNMIGHEILHGGMGGSKPLQRWLASLCGTPILVPAYVWELGHMYRHHAATNHPFRDSDAIGLIGRYMDRPDAQKVIDKFPGSSRWSSLLFYTYALTYQQIDRGIRMKGHKGRVVKIEFAVMVAFWAVIALLSGWNAIFTVIIPFMAGNAISLSYITTQHFLRPLSKENNAVDTTLGLSQPKWIASMHLNNAYHLEHHLFPSIPFNKLPAVRKVLLEEFPDKMFILPYWVALKWVFKTPRVYADEYHLVDLRNPSQWFDLRAFERAILDPNVDMTKAKVSDFMVTQG